MTFLGNIQNQTILNSYTIFKLAEPLFLQRHDFFLDYPRDRLQARSMKKRAINPTHTFQLVPSPQYCELFYNEF